MSFDAFWPDVAPLAQAIANEFGRKNRVYGADESDFLQEYTVWLLENERQVTEWHTELEPKEFGKMIGRCLRNESKDYALDIKSQALGYERGDLYFYSKGELRALLPMVFDKEKWHEPPQSDGRSAKSYAEGNNWVATLADVAQAVERLDLYDKSILKAFHRDGWTNKMMAEAEDVSEQMMSYYHDRAVKRLLQQLGDSAPRPMREGSKKDPWRGRHACSSSTARAYQSSVYAGSDE